MPSTTTAAESPAVASLEFSIPQSEVPRIRKNGQNWKPANKPFRPTSKPTTVPGAAYNARQALRKQMTVTKAKENELKKEKEDERQRRIQGIKDRRVAKEEKERYEMLAQKMHAKRVERLRRREKRNKALKER